MGSVARGRTRPDLVAVPDPMFHVMALGAFLGVALEFAAFFLMPWLLARAAFIRVGVTRRIPLGPKAREALSTAPAHAGGYREPAARRFDLSRLGLPETLAVPGFVAKLYPARGFAIARAPYTFTNKVVALARVDIVEHDGAIEVRGRFIPVTWLTLALVVPLFGVGTLVANGASRDTFESIAMGAVFLAVNIGVGYFFSRRAMANAVDGVYRQVELAVYAANQ